MHMNQDPQNNIYITYNVIVRAAHSHSSLYTLIQVYGEGILLPNTCDDLHLPD